MMTQSVRLSSEMIAKYMSNLTNRFYKILPIRENEPETLKDYIGSLLLEMIGCQSFIAALDNDDRYLTLLSTLEYMKGHNMEIRDVRREVFRCIGVIKKLQEKYGMREEAIQ